MKWKKRLIIEFLAILLLLAIIASPFTQAVALMGTNDYPRIMSPWGIEVPLLLPRGIHLVSIKYFEDVSKNMFCPDPSIMLDKPPVLPFQFVLEGTGPTMYDVIAAISAGDTGLDGEGVVVGIVDTGIDFSAKGLGMDSIAYTPDGVPLLFDADEFGLAITPLNVTMNPYTRALNTSGSSIEVYIPGSGTALVYVDYDWTAPSVNSASGTYHFGFLIQYSFAGNYILGSNMPAIAFLVPIVLVDSSEPGVYDTVFVDLSTTWFTIAGFYYALGGLLNPPDMALLDFSFADETPIRMGENICYYDADGDGISDFSIGVISGYVYDAYGIINSSVVEPDSLWENGWEPLGSGIYPGLDKEGRYVSFFYDPMGHGTSVASIIGGRETKFFVPTVNGLLKIEERGIAPGVKFAGAMALWNGNVLAALYWLSGHDYVNGSWIYSGKHRADIISNSWGVLYWQGLLLADGGGFPPGDDPLAYHLNRIANKTILVFAAGNEGPARESIAIGGAAQNVITVGASTVLGSPIYDSYGHLVIPSGLSDNIISWSSRGPASLGGPKPDVVAPGAYALVPTAVINGMGDGTRAVDIFGGTSMATPVVSGSIALILEKLRDVNITGFTTNNIKQLLVNGADDLGYPPGIQGAGRINVTRSLMLLNVSDNKLEHYELLRVYYINNKIYIPTDDYHSSLVLYGGKQVYYEENITTEQYEEMFFEVPLPPTEDYSYITITLSSDSDFINQELPLAVAWIGGWIDENNDNEKSVNEIILCDHTIISGRTVTLHISKKLVDTLVNEGAILNDSLVLYIFSASGIANSFRLTASVFKEYVFSPTSVKGEKLAFEVPEELVDYGSNLGLLISSSGEKRIVEIIRPVKLGSTDMVLNVSSIETTHSSISGGLGDLFTIKLSVVPGGEYTEEGKVIGYVIEAPKDDVDLYVATEETVFNGLAHISYGFASHPIGYLPSLDGFYPLPKVGEPKIFVPTNIIDRGLSYLLVYVIDNYGKDHIELDIYPVIYRESRSGSSVYYYIASNASLGRVMLSDDSIIIHEKGFITGYHGITDNNTMIFLDFPKVRFESKWLYGLETKSDFGVFVKLAPFYAGGARVTPSIPV